MNKLCKTTLIIFLFVFLINISLISAQMTYDNVKENLIINANTSKYGSIEIKDWFGLQKLAKLELKKNTDTCGFDCSMETEIIMYQDGVLIDDVKFLERQDNKIDWIETSIEKYQFYIKTGGSEWLVDDYTTDCNSAKVSINGSGKLDCSQVKSGSHYENNYTYEKYEIGTSLKTGIYYVKLEGTRSSDKWIDWVITSQGKELDFWYTWGDYVDRIDLTATAGSGLFGISTNGSVWAILRNADDTVYFYDMSWNYLRSWSTEVGEATGIANNGSNWFVMDYNTNDVYKYDINGTSLGVMCSTGYEGSMTLYTNGTRMWTGLVDESIKEMDMNCNQIRSFSVGYSGWGITSNGSNLYVQDGHGGQAIKEYTFGGTATGHNFNLNASQTSSYGITLYNGYFYSVETTGYIYKYFQQSSFIPSVVTTILNSPIDNYNSSSSSIIFNCSANTTSPNGELLTNISLWLNITGTWLLNETKDVSGTYNNSIFTKNIPDGLNYAWTCRTYDNSTSSAWGTNRTFSIDTIYPLISIVYPANNTNTTDKTIDVNYTRSDANLASCWYSNDTWATNTTLASCTNITTVTWAEGQHNVIIWVNDSVGNVNSSSVRFNIDTTAPKINYIPPTPDDGVITNINNFTVSVNVNDTNLNNVTFNLYNSTGSLINESLMNYKNNSLCYQESANTTNQGGLDGNCNLNYSGAYIVTGATNSSLYDGNWETHTSPGSDGSSYLTINYTIPRNTVGGMLRVKDNTIGDRNVTIDNTCITNKTNKVLEIYLQEHVTNLLTFYCFNNLGAVTLSPGNYGGNYFYEEAIIWIISPYSQTYYNLPDGIYYYNVTATDILNNQNSTATRSLTVDTIYPLISIVYPANNTNTTDKTIDVNYTRSDANLASCWYSNDTWATNTTLASCTNITTVTWAEGQHNVIIWVNDSVGNVNSSSVRFNIDTTAPNVIQNYTIPSGGGGSITIPAINNSYQNQSNITFVANVSDINGISNITIIVNYTNGTLVNQTTVQTYGVLDYIFGIPLYLLDGAYNWVVNAYDPFSNFVTTTVMKLTVDTTLPAIAITYPTNTYYNYALAYLNWTLNEINPDTCWYTNNTGVTNWTTFCLGLNASTSSVEGSNTWTIYTNDSAGNLNQNSVTFTVDTTVPLISIVYPANNTNTTDKTIDVNYTRSDANLASCWYSNDTWATNTTLASCTNITTVTWAEGQHNVIIWVNDTAGNTNSSSVRFTIDSTTPIITINSPIRLIDYGYAGKNETLEWTITDSNLASIWYKYNPTYNYSSTLNYLFDDNFTNVAPANDLAAGTYYFNLVNTQTFLNISSWDAANAVSYTDTIILTSCSNNLITLIKNSTASGAYYNFLCGSTSLGSVIYSRVGLNFHYPSEITLNNINNNQTYTAYGASNSTNFTLKKDFYAITVYANDSYGNINSSYVEWVYKIFYNNETYNTQSYETSTETFTINVTANSSLTAANLIYGVNSYAGTNLGSGIWSKTLDIPLGSANNNFYWNFTYAGNQISSLTKTQTVNYTNLSICGGTGGNTIFLNFSFKDETTGNFINVSNDLADFDYWLGSGTVTKPYIFTNTTENFLYQFCAVPNKTITVDLSYKYSKTGYPQRTFVYDNQLLTNSTTSKTLYLLSNVDGIYSTLQFLDAGTNAPISGVTVIIQREIAGLWTLISQGLTDATGSITFWVNPNYEHLITGTRIGYAGVSKIITPTQSSYTIFMGVSSNISVPGYRYKNIKYITYPGSGRLEPNTVYIFGFNVTATDGNIISCKIDIKNLTLSTVATSSVGCGEYGGNISVSYNTGSNSKLFGYYYIDIGSGIELFKANDAWFIEYQNITSSGGLKGFFDALRDLPEFGDTHNRQEFSKIVFFFFMMILVIGLFTFFSGIDLSSPGAALILVWAFIAFGSVSGIIKIEGLSPFSWWNQYGIFIITSFLFFGFILNMMRRDSN